MKRFGRNVYGHTMDYKKRLEQEEVQRRRRILLDRGFWLRAPRVILLCRLRGHKPVVDGYDSNYSPGDEHRARWVCCDRCGIRPRLQGSLNPDQWNLGDPYTGNWDSGVPTDQNGWERYVRTAKERGSSGGSQHYLPGGGFPSEERGAVGGQLILGKTHTSGISFKLGSRHSEEVLAANVSIHPLGALYLHAEDYGQWLQRRFNRTGEPIRLELRVHDGSLWWKIGPDDGVWSRDKARWRDGSIGLNPMKYLFGPKQYSYIDQGDPVEAVVRMPQGDNHTVTLQLQEQRFGRRDLPSKFQAWTVSWSTDHDPIATEAGNHGRTYGGAVTVPTVSVKRDSWRDLAASLVASDLAKDRARNQYQHETAT